MYPENIVTSLEISLKFKELGVLQLSYFYWSLEDDEWEVVPMSREPEEKNVDFIDSWIENDLIISAFTATELGIMLDCHCPYPINPFNEEAIASEIIDGYKGGRVYITEDENGGCWETTVARMNANLKKFWESK